MWWRIVLLSLAYLTLGAHFLRFGSHLAAIAIALAPCLLFFKRTWTVSLLQIGLVAGTFLVWLPTTYRLIYTRMHFEQDWIRMACILGAVMIFTLLISYTSGALKQKYPVT
ncbi:hypothetical protein [Parendozoicomonas sp. Alg238-R29]|uniref:hypothetical protein n=1 Tax=Parendozoicomonas sp. Alg238-R29 TaxID=2993446 RepID=UPI00248D7999|nr:hypothetical protein [Parendozoicomonas sp. Alg238-R29]